MCLITKQDVPKIAKKDIKVYKLLNKEDKDSARSIYRYFCYELNTTYKTNIEDIDDPCTFDNKSTLYLKETYPGWGDNISVNRRALISNNLKSYGPGFHSCVTKERCYPTAKDGPYDLYECTIPAGSEYYEDGNDLIVSNQIIINRLVDEQ